MYNYRDNSVLQEREDKLIAAYNRGVKDREAGLPLNAAPENREMEYRECWRRGWWAADRKLRD